jgi:polysaccharide deacetylase 2 family uncharacterized protein YibQ
MVINAYYQHTLLSQRKLSLYLPHYRFYGLHTARVILFVTCVAVANVYTSYSSALGYNATLSEVIELKLTSSALAIPFYKNTPPLETDTHKPQIVIPDSPLPLPIKTVYKTSVAIIIDDLGYNYEQGLKAMQLPGAITYAIIPHSPKAFFFAQEAQKNNKEIMLHAPMSTINHNALGKNGLTELMDENDFKRTLNQSLASLPNVKGLNNHMGSLLTQKNQPMSWVMQSLKPRQLYFIDSRTSAKSVAWDVAQQYNIPSLKRDVFLDHEPNEAFIDKQFKLLITIAKRQGYAVAIAHPYPETVQYLSRNLSVLNDAGISLVPASELVKRFSPNQMSPKTAKNVNAITQTITK